jgi:hypothetical protein
LREEIKRHTKAYAELSQFNSLEALVSSAIIDQMRSECALQIHLNRACRKIMRSRRWSQKFCDRVLEDRLDEKGQIALAYEFADFIQRSGVQNEAVFT